MATAWQSGELLLTLWQERRWRENGYRPLSLPTLPVLADSVQIEADMDSDPRTHALSARDTAHLHTDECLRRLDLVAKGTYQYP